MASNLCPIGPNTTKGFADPSEKGIALGPDDIFFVDIGPIHRAFYEDLLLDDQSF